MESIEKKLIFVINHYAADSDQHLTHVLHLVDVISQKGVQIALIIERCEGEPPVINSNVKVFAQKQKAKMLRFLEFIFVAARLIKAGYKKVFVRITVPTAKSASVVARLLGGESYYWNSGGLNERPDAPHTSPESLKTIKRLKSVGKSVDHFVTGPESMLDFYPKYCGVPKEKMLLLYNDIDLNRFYSALPEKKTALRKELNLDSNKKYILFVHRFSPIRRNLFYIPYCLKDIQDDNVVFLMIGSGPEEQAARGAVAASGQKNIVFLGSQPNMVIQKYYQACDVFFNPSYCEGFPRVIIEAMACGLPIVTTNAGGTEDLFDPCQREYVVDIDNRDELAEKLGKMIKSDEVQQICSAENLERVKMYATEVVADMYIRAFWPEGDDEAHGEEK